MKFNFRPKKKCDCEQCGFDGWYVMKAPKSKECWRKSWKQYEKDLRSFD